eukprot:747849-Hanusia_phi.AAC.3
MGGIVVAGKQAIRLQLPHLCVEEAAGKQLPDLLQDLLLLVVVEGELAEEKGDIEEGVRLAISRFEVKEVHLLYPSVQSRHDREHRHSGALRGRKSGEGGKRNSSVRQQREGESREKERRRGRAGGRGEG